VRKRHDGVGVKELRKGARGKNRCSLLKSKSHKAIEIRAQTKRERGENPDEEEGITFAFPIQERGSRNRPLSYREKGRPKYPNSQS